MQSAGEGEEKDHDFLREKQCGGGELTPLFSLSLFLSSPSQQVKRFPYSLPFT